MDGRFILRRTADQNEWSWESTPGDGGPIDWRNLRVVLGAAAVGVLLVAAAITGLFFGVVRDGDGTPVVIESPTPTQEGTPTPVVPSPSPTPVPTTPSPTPVPTPSPTPQPTQAPLGTLSLYWLDAEAGEWRTDAIVSEESPFGEGDLVAFLVRLEDVPSGENLTVRIHYSSCAAPLGESFDFLSGLPDVPEQALLAPPGPGRATPDVTLAIPDDPSITFDGGARIFRLWGAVFNEAAEGPLTACPEGRTVILRMRTAAPEIVLGFAAHLASPEDWPGQGAALAEAPFGLTVEVSSVGSETVEVTPFAIERQSEAD